MAKTETAAEQAAPEVVAVATPEVSLDEFCSRLSETVRSPEMIAAFHHTERAAGRVRGTPEAYKASFDKFVNQPV